MAIVNEEVREMGSGIAKKIDEGALDSILDNLQASQYQFPIRSTTRELLCNGIDSVKEKNMAREILSGRAQVSDYFVEREGALYKDSHFNPDYYDPEFFSEEDTVSITYVTGDNLTRDKVIFNDNGVGLGGKRLEGYFSLGYSTKRLSKLPLGKFGIGAKSPLSVGIDFFTMESRWNGRLFRFNIYSSTYDCIIPKVNLATGKENPFVLFYEGTPHETKVYYEETDKKNGVSIFVDAKKHHKKEYIDAVKQQMMYFDGIDFTLIEENGVSMKINYKANILYEDDAIILSDNSYYAKPHILLNGVNYGYVNWEELELENKQGNIAIKVKPEDIKISPSRESIIWSDMTKIKVLERFKDVVGIAERLIAKELEEPDFLKWIKACYSITNRYSTETTIIGRLAKIVDIRGIKPKYHKDPRIIFSQSDMMDGMQMEIYSYKEVEVRDPETKKVIDYRRKIVKDKALNFGNHINMPIVLISDEVERMNNKINKYLLQQYGPFLAIREPMNMVDTPLEKLEERWTLMGIPEEEIEKMKAFRAKNYSNKDLLISRNVIYDFLKESDGVLEYAKIEIPEGFVFNDDDNDDAQSKKKTEEQLKKIETENQRLERERIANMTAAELRKERGEIIIRTPVMNASAHNNHVWTDANGNVQSSLNVMSWAPINVKTAELLDLLKDEEVYYGNDTDTDTLELVMLLTRDPFEDNFPGRNQTRAHVAAHQGNKNYNTPYQRMYHWNKWEEFKYLRKNLELVKKYVNPNMGYNCQHLFDTQGVQIVKVAKQNNKQMRNFRHINDFFIRLEGGTITMSNKLIRWNTARQIKELLPQLQFMNGWAGFNTEIHKIWWELTEYVRRNYIEVGQIYLDGKHNVQADTYTDFISHMDKVQQMQEFVKNNSGDTEQIAKLAVELFANKGISNGNAVEMEFIDKVRYLQEYANHIGCIFNHVSVLVNGSYIPDSLDLEIRAYLEYKDVLNYPPYDNSPYQTDQPSLPSTQTEDEPIVTQDLEVVDSFSV